MKEQVLGFNISLLVHGIVVAALFALGQGKMFENKPIVIDLSIVSRDISSGTAVSSGLSRDTRFTPSRPSTIRKEKRHAVEPPILPRKKIIKPAKKVNLVPPVKNQPKVPQAVQPKPETMVWKAADSGKTPPTFNDAPVTTSGTHETMSNAGTHRPTPGVKTRLSARGQDGGNPGNVGQTYLNIHFSYLRERIQKHLCYPTIARKKGWSGKVLVGFTILKNGHVDDLEIKKSCGIKLLDHSAMETVRTACPFPEPPALAKIVIPIMYKLD